MPRPAPKDLEIELILCCSRVAMDAVTEERVRAIVRNEPDWEFVLQTSRRHAVDMLLYRSLARVNSADIPSTVHTKLRQYAHSNVVKCLFLTAQLLNLLELFRRSGIHAIPFKGPVLGVLAYGDVTLRRFGDLDILIRKGDFAKTNDLLRGRGFRPWRDLSTDEEATHVASEHAYTFISGDGRVSIDLHWDLLQRRFALVDTELFWEQLTSVTIAGRAVPSLRSEDLVLYLCLHGAKHSWERLAWICDVAEFVRTQQNIEWNLVWEAAKHLRCQRLLLGGLCMAMVAVGVDPPEAMSKRIDRRMLATAVRLKNQLFAETLPYREAVNRIFFYSKMRERWRDQIPYFRHALRLFLRPGRKDRELLPLPAGLGYLHYVFRPLRLLAIVAWQAAASIWRRTSNAFRHQSRI